jgi:hypothetical protein
MDEKPPCPWHGQLYMKLTKRNRYSETYECRSSASRGGCGFAITIKIAYKRDKPLSRS